ncbi:hypothetical protein GCM10020358_65510 [Amorphoplanes nipponensis]|uniref:Peptide O-xylosyltransferase n=1 Tax=Actinoplanes nipponensis TaxID=135950 RepID=A0A919MJC4_9ACTN|nr:beta-1,6-N-acetylglucosaminyltransferase [Actinoplanes nipponensis]GIE51664.1 hypothetical protein Ani05nite_51980 [Actinoplanes nipponensis]
MTPLAVVILAHADPVHLRRLITALDDTPVVLHCDARTDDRSFAAMVDGLPGRVRVAPRQRTTVTSWSLVTAELQALKIATTWTDARHIAVLSGADYPLLPMADIVQELRAWDGLTWIENTPVPVASWDTARHPDGGLWRFQHRFLTRAHQVLYWRDVPLRFPWKRSVPEDLSLRAASQWKIYSRAHARALHRLVDQRPDLVRFWSTTLVPDESFAASMLGSPKLLGGDALAPCPSGAWYMNWDNDRPGHPRWLSDNDFDQLKSARWAPHLPLPGTTAGTLPIPDGEPTPYRKLFARKFRSSDPTVVDQVDAELRS